jgi:hypothetical protein
MIMEEGRVNLDQNNANNPNPSQTNYPIKHGNLSKFKEAPPEWETRHPIHSPITNKGGRTPPSMGRGRSLVKKGKKGKVKSGFSTSK